MTLKHKIKLIIPRFKWFLKKRNQLKEFRQRADLFTSLTKQAEELEIEYNAHMRQQPNANTSAETPLARLHYTRGKLDNIKEILNDK